MRVLCMGPMRNLLVCLRFGECLIQTGMSHLALPPNILGEC